MQSTELSIEEQKVSDLTGFMNHFKTQRTLTENVHKQGQFVHINFSANLEAKKNVGGISGWKNFDYSVIEVIWVDPDYQKNKIGKKIVESFIAKSKALGCNTVITTINNHSGSEYFWNKCGFIPFAEVDTNSTKITYLKRLIDSEMDHCL